MDTADLWHLRQWLIEFCVSRSRAAQSGGDIFPNYIRQRVLQAIAVLTKRGWARVPGLQSEVPPQAPINPTSLPRSGKGWAPEQRQQVISGLQSLMALPNPSLVSPNANGSGLPSTVAPLTQTLVGLSLACALIDEFQAARENGTAKGKETISKMRLTWAEHRWCTMSFQASELISLLSHRSRS